jgi:hypothetical protein
VKLTGSKFYVALPPQDSLHRTYDAALEGREAPPAASGFHVSLTAGGHAHHALKLAAFPLCPTVPKLVHVSRFTA